LEDDEALWKRILGNEMLWTAVLALGILIVALYLAT
jgi:hypothetical protein